MANIRITVPEDSEIRESFEFTDPEFGSYRDAIFFRASDYEKSGAAKKQQLKKDRFEAWRNYMRDLRDNPPVTEEPQVEDE